MLSWHHYYFLSLSQDTADTSHAYISLHWGTLSPAGLLGISAPGVTLNQGEAGVSVSLKEIVFHVVS